MGRPISGKHAIEVAAFACVFTKPFSPGVIEALMTLKETFREDYPVFSTTKVVEMRLEKENVQPSASQSIAGVSLHVLNDQHKPAWTLRADANSIVVSCHVYNRWGSESPKALNDLTKVIDVVADDQNPVSQLYLQTVDRFVGGNPDSYKLNQVFNSRSRYLPKQIREAGALWHVYQGWFDSIEESPDKILHNLNLSTNETPHGVITTIDHSARYNFSQVTPASGVSNLEITTKHFDLLHQTNKQIISDLLIKKQCRNIGLCL